MKLSIIPSILALASCALAAPGTLKPFLKRNPTGSFSLIAYSLESSVVDIFYSDGMYMLRPMRAQSSNHTFTGIAYAGDSSKWTYGSVTTDVTCKFFQDFF